MEQNGPCLSRSYCGRLLAGAPSAASTLSSHRPCTPSEHSGRSPFVDSAESDACGYAAPGPSAKPPTSSSVSRSPSTLDSFSALTALSEERGRRYFHSRRVKKNESLEKPWLKKKDPKEKWITIFPILGLLVGLSISAFLIYDGINSVVKHKYCLVLHEDFSGGLNSDVWTKEVQAGGFGNGEFEITTRGDENMFIENGKLIIKPTLRDSKVLEQDAVMDPLENNTSPSQDPKNRVASVKTPRGNATFLSPIKSGRITTKKGATIKYGRVEVTARLPRGDWLWPAVWMLPVEDTYGPWPASGEIDILESRGNDHTYPQGGNNIVSSALHWGPNAEHDAWRRTTTKRSALHTTYSDRFHTFGLEWSQGYLFTYVDSRLLQVIYINFNEPMWERGNFPPADVNGTRMEDLWSQTGRDNTPFDQPFYLILNVAVGGTNGWFEDGVHGKPWVDGSQAAKESFWEARGDWLPTWTKPEMEVSKVVMWKQCDGNENH